MKSFNRILDSIKALERIREGDLSMSEEAKDYNGSRTDERGADDTITDNIELKPSGRMHPGPRGAKNQIIFEKMSLLSSSRGGARRMLRREITEMRAPFGEMMSKKENVSIELLSRAFSTMSEVANLIERTHELVAARDEIGSSIRYEQNFRTRCCRPRCPPKWKWKFGGGQRYCGGGIYFIKEYPQSLYRSY